jgi:hypothetical protein
MALINLAMKSTSANDFLPAGVETEKAQLNNNKSDRFII